MTADEQVQEWRSAMASPEGRADPIGMGVAILEVLAGCVTPDTRAPMPVQVSDDGPWGVTLTMRQRKIMSMAQGIVLTSGMLARTLNWSEQTMRDELKALEWAGLLMHEGEKRGSRYRLCNAESGG